MSESPKCKLALREVISSTNWFQWVFQGLYWLRCKRSYGQQTVLSDHFSSILSHGILSAAQEFTQCQTNAIRSKQLMINLFPDQFWKKTLKLITILRIILWGPKDKLQTKPFFLDLLLKRLHFFWGDYLCPDFELKRMAAVSSLCCLHVDQIQSSNEELFSFRPCTL